MFFSSRDNILDLFINNLSSLILIFIDSPIKLISHVILTDYEQILVKQLRTNHLVLDNVISIHRLNPL
jgi:hypothetical protein